MRALMLACALLMALAGGYVGGAGKVRRESLAMLAAANKRAAAAEEKLRAVPETCREIAWWQDKPRNLSGVRDLFGLAFRDMATSGENSGARAVDAAIDGRQTAAFLYVTFDRDKAETARAALAAAGLVTPAVQP